jgi:hypothetical protein
MAFKGVDTFGTLGVDNPFLNSLRGDGTIATNCPMVMFAFYDPTSFTTKYGLESLEIGKSWNPNLHLRLFFFSFGALAISLNRLTLVSG